MFEGIDPPIVEQIVVAVLMLLAMAFGTNLVTEVIKKVSRLMGKPSAAKEAWWNGIRGEWSWVVALVIAFLAVPKFGLDFMQYIKIIDLDPQFAELLNQLGAVFGASFLHNKVSGK